MMRPRWAIVFNFCKLYSATAKHSGIIKTCFGKSQEKLKKTFLQGFKLTTGRVTPNGQFFKDDLTICRLREVYHLYHFKPLNILGQGPGPGADPTRGQTQGWTKAWARPRGRNPTMGQTQGWTKPWVRPRGRDPTTGQAQGWTQACKGNINILDFSGDKGSLKLNQKCYLILFVNL